MSRKVLVVDDEKLIVKGLRFSLEQDGMEVDCAYDGEEALEKAKAGEYDIILLDLMLPKMDGLEVCQQIREFSNVPIIMLTAKGEDMDKILGLEYGADDYQQFFRNLVYIIDPPHRHNRKTSQMRSHGYRLGFQITDYPYSQIRILESFQFRFELISEISTFYTMDGTNKILSVIKSHTCFFSTEMRMIIRTIENIGNTLFA